MQNRNRLVIMPFNEQTSGLVLLVYSFFCFILRGVLKPSTFYFLSNKSANLIGYIDNRYTKTVFSMKKGNRLKIKTLPKGWSDNDSMMLHACFKLLKKFIENEKPFKHLEWNYDDEHRSVKEELKFLYDWWKKRKKLKESHQMMNNRLHPQNIEDTEMLLRLIKIRTFLWC
jgi:pyruvate formate-lyase activating enzyme-like uncharacterized protein